MLYCNTATVATTRRAGGRTWGVRARAAVSWARGRAEQAAAGARGTFDLTIHLSMEAASVLLPMYIIVCKCDFLTQNEANAPVIFCFTNT